MAKRHWYSYVTKDDHTIPGGVNDAWWITTESYAKENSDESPYLIANEWICGRIAQYLCLQIPPFSLVRKGGKGKFASLNFSISGTPPADADPVQCVHALTDLSTGILLFDILIANADRHEGNLTVDSQVDPTEIIIFDHERALFGMRDKKGKKRLSDLWERLGVSAGSITGENRHVFLDTLSTAEFFLKWTERIQQIPTWYIEDACRYVIGQGISKTEANTAIAFLKNRRNKIEEIVKKHKSEFTNITNWGLIL